MTTQYDAATIKADVEYYWDWLLAEVLAGLEAHEGTPFGMHELTDDDEFYVWYTRIRDGETYPMLEGETPDQATQRLGVARERLASATSDLNDDGVMTLMLQKPRPLWPKLLQWKGYFLANGKLARTLVVRANRIAAAKGLPLDEIVED